MLTGRHRRRRRRGSAPPSDAGRRASRVEEDPAILLDVGALERADDRHARRSCEWHWDDDGSLVLRARMSPEDGAVVVKALEAAAALADGHTPPADVPAGTPERPDRPAARRADALVAADEVRVAGFVAPQTAPS